MKVKDVFTIDRVSNASTGYSVALVKLEKFALVDISYTPPPAGVFGAPGTKHFTFQAIEAGKAEVQFAVYRPWLLPVIKYEDVITFDVKEADSEAEEAAWDLSLNPGGWTPFTAPSEDALAVFNEAFKDFVGSGYKPLAVTTQLINGANYIFAANAHPVSPNFHEYPVLVHIFKPLSGPARRVKFHHLGSPAAAYGGFGPFHETTEEEKKLLQQAVGGLVGVSYEALLTSTQVVAGHNFKFIGTRTQVTVSADKSPVLFTVHQPLSGVPSFTGVHPVYDLV
jgi:predicted secreted protein